MPKNLIFLLKDSLQLPERSLFDYFVILSVIIYSFPQHFFLLDRLGEVRIFKALTYDLIGRYQNHKCCGIKFTDDAKAEFYQVHHKDCVTYHRQSGAELKDETWTSMSEDWFMKGSTSVKLTYQIDDKENKLSLSSGKVYFLKLDENGQKYIGLTNEKGTLVYVLASVDDEKYNSVIKKTWEIGD